MITLIFNLKSRWNNNNNSFASLCAESARVRCVAYGREWSTDVRGRQMMIRTCKNKIFIMHCLSAHLELWAPHRTGTGCGQWIELR